jgi:hypothetical protein
MRIKWHPSSVNSLKYYGYGAFVVGSEHLNRSRASLNLACMLSICDRS